MDTGSTQGATTAVEVGIVPGGSPSVLAALERTTGCEDVRFSPNARRLALARSDTNTIVVVDLDVDIDPGLRVTVTGVAELSSPHLRYPHGVDFLDDETIVVSNRHGDVSVHRLPPVGARSTDLVRVDRPAEPPSKLLHGPGSLVVATGVDGGTEVLVCNNHDHTVTRHVVDDDPCELGRGSVLLRRWLAFPDGIALADDGAWVAVTNHDSHTALVYEGWATLDVDADPDCILRGVSYPHGVCFSPDGRHAFVAGCGGPHVHVFARDGERWGGVRYPALTLQVMDDDVFRSHPRSDQGDGGPKGVDVDRHGRVLAVASEHQQLAFFDVAAILERSADRAPDQARQLRYELEVLDRTLVLEAHVAALKQSTSYRVTTPLRSIKAVWLKLRAER